MPDIEPPLALPARDLADETHTRTSLRASLERRARRARRLRTTRGGRRAVVAATALLAVGSAGAVAQTTTGAPDPPTPAADSGYDVKAVQSKLGVVADGIFGPKSRAALKRFQRSNGLTPDGVVGAATLQALGLGGAPRALAASASGVSPQLAAIAQCESGGDPTAVSANGRYRGKYQFSRATWTALGGTGDPAAAPEPEQDLRAVALMQRQGPSAWPVCSRS